MHGGGRMAALLAVAALALGGCGGFGGGVTSLAGVDCSGLPSGACDELTQQVQAGVSGQVQSIAFTCRLASCTRAQGAGTALVTLADGSTVTRQWSYTGDPGPAPVPVCIRIPLAECQAAAAQLVDNVPPSKRVIGIKISCTAVSCTAASGEADVLITLGDGSSVSNTYGWMPAGS